jgi:hypothetical protein
MREACCIFIGLQVLAMPSLYRTMIVPMLIAFDLHAFIFYGRRFQRLGLVQKKQHLSRWQQGFTGLQRDLVKLIRTCFVISFYDHPAVLRVMEQTRA